MKKFMAMTMAMVMAAMALTGCGSSNAADDKASGDIPVIGINQYGQHASLDNCREGFLQGLEEAGLKEGVDYKIEYQNAGFDDNTDCTELLCKECCADVCDCNTLRNCLLCGGRG